MKRRKLDKTKTENKSYRRCQQTKCAFFLNGGCKACDKCKAEPFTIKKDCKRCFACENIPNALRWGEKLSKEKLELMQVINGIVRLFKEHEQQEQNRIEQEAIVYEYPINR